MDKIERQQRTRVVAEARSWLGTPYHHNQRRKGAGVDCANLPAAVYHASGMIPEISPEEYPAQWHMHGADNDEAAERYLNRVLEYAREIDGAPDMGDFILWKVGRRWAHGAIVIEWPVIIHAVGRPGLVMLGDAERDAFDRKFLRDRAPRYFTLWGG